MKKTRSKAQQRKTATRSCSKAVWSFVLAIAILVSTIPYGSIATALTQENAENVPAIESATPAGEAPAQAPEDYSEQNTLKESEENSENNSLTQPEESPELYCENSSLENAEEKSEQISLKQPEESSDQDSYKEPEQYSEQKSLKRPTEESDHISQNERNDTEAAFANSISGSLWLDVLVDDTSIHGDGIRQEGEGPLVDYEVNLYLAADRETPVQTVRTDAQGVYRFENMEPGSYVVGISTANIAGTEYLLPIAEMIGDNKFAEFNEEYTTIYSEVMDIEEDTVITGIDVGMRTPIGVEPSAAVTAGVGAQLYTANRCNYIITSYSRESDLSLTISHQYRYYNYSNNRYSATYSLATDAGFTNIVSTGSFGTGRDQNPALSFNLSFTNLPGGNTYYLKFKVSVWDDAQPGYVAKDQFDTKNDFNQYFVIPAVPEVTVGTVSVKTETITHTAVTVSVPVNTQGRTEDVHLYISTNNGGSWSGHDGSLNATGNTIFQFTFNDLMAGTTYWLRVYVRDTTYSTWRYSDTKMTENPITTIGAPIKGTIGKANITTTSVDLSMTFDANPGSSTVSTCRICDHTVAYMKVGGSGWTHRANLMGSTVNDLVRGTGTGTLSGLEPGTDYLVWIGLSNNYLRNDIANDTTIVSFTTLPEPPVIASASEINVTRTNAQIIGTWAGGTPTSWSFHYKTDNSDWTHYNPCESFTTNPDGTFTAPTFSQLGVTLTPNTSYLVHIYAYNAGGNSGAKGIPFTTLPDFTSWEPTPSSTDVTRATVSGTYAGTAKITGATIAYGLLPDVSDGTLIPLTKVTDFTDSGFSYELTGLTAGQTYYVKTTVTNAAGTTESTVKPFQTLPLLEISVPVKLMFASFASGGGDVISPDYEITNRSLLPVKVSLTEFHTDTLDGLSLVQTAPSSDGQLQLSLMGGTNFATVNGLPNGTLAGGYMGELGVKDSATATGQFTVGGRYQGSFAAPKEPRFHAVFTFALVLPNGP